MKLIFPPRKNNKKIARALSKNADKGKPKN
jgi:hypothetical protein